MPSRSHTPEGEFSLAPTDPAATLLTAHPAPGLVIAGKYELVSKIGEGGMGEVWRAQDLRLKSPVAVKLPTVPDTADARARFFQEAELAAAVRGSHVVQVFEHGIDGHIPFIVMELLEGQTLSDRRKSLRTLSPDEVMFVVHALGKALTRAHRKGVIHRDLKPGNVFLVTHGTTIDEVKVLDFGVAKLRRTPIDRRALTVPGNVVGTAYYISPEQLRATKELDHRADLWSVAVIACECLTGRRPFDAADLETLSVQLESARRPVPSQLSDVDIPAGFDAWFAKATAPNIDDRFQSADELVAALEPICGSRPAVRLPPLVQQTQEPPRPTIAPVTRTHNASRLPFLSAHPKVRIALVAGPTTAVLTTALLYLLRSQPLVETRLAAPANSAPATLLPLTAPEIIGTSDVVPAAAVDHAPTPQQHMLPPEPQGGGVAPELGSAGSLATQSPASAAPVPSDVRLSPPAPSSTIAQPSNRPRKTLRKTRPRTEVTHPTTEASDTEERILRTEY